MKKIIAPLVAIALLALPAIAWSQSGGAPVRGTNVSLAVTTASGEVGLLSAPSAFPYVLLLNDGANELFYGTGSTPSVAVTTAAVPLPPGTCRVEYLNGNGFVAAITQSSTTTLRAVQFANVPPGASCSPVGAGGGSGGGAVQLQDGSGNPISSTSGALNVNLSSGAVTANAGTNLNTSALALESGGNLAGINGKLTTTANGLKVDPSAVTQPVSGNVGQSGAWTMQPGNTPNTSPWLTTVNQGGNSAAVTAGAAPSGTPNALEAGIADGYSVSLGAKADSAYAGSGAASVVAILKGLYTGITSAIPAGSANIGGIEIFDSGGTNKLSVSGAGAAKVDGSAVTQPVSGNVTPTPGTTTGETPGHFLSAASNNSTSVKGSAGTLYDITVVQTTTTLADLRLYDTASAPTCSSSTGVVTNLPVQSNATSPGFHINFGATGKKFVNGIGICLTGANADNDNTNSVTGINVNYDYQ